MFAQGVLARPKTTRRRFAYHDGWRRIGLISFGEYTTLEQRDGHGFKVAGTNDSGYYDRHPVRRRISAPFNRYPDRISAASYGRLVATAAELTPGKVSTRRSSSS
jgi:hypothetical protein